VRLRISVEDRKGILAGRQFSNRRHQHQHSRRRGDRWHGTTADSIRMTVEISDVKHLERVMKSIKKIEGV
jgi:(p)ppGpp synthase/HD superfamily hydrolase